MSDSPRSLVSSDKNGHESQPQIVLRRLPDWLRLTRWRVLWLAGVIMFAWVTASIWLYREMLIEFSPETLEFRTRIRFVLLGTSISFLSTDFDSSQQPNDHRSLLNFLLESGYWRREPTVARWILVRHSWAYGTTDNRFYKYVGWDSGNFYDLWIARGLYYGNRTGQCFWIAWSKKFPDEAKALWPSIQEHLRAELEPTDRRLIQPLNEAFASLDDKDRRSLTFEAMLRGGGWKRNTMSQPKFSAEF